MQRITAVGVLSLGKVMGAAGFCLGIVFSVLYGVLFAALGLAQDRPDFLWIAAGIFILGPLIYGVLSFLGGLLNGVILNLVFKLAGGLEIRLEP